MINQFLFGEQQWAQEIIIQQKKTWKTYLHSLQDWFICFKGQIFNRILTNKMENDNYLELMNNQIENLRNYEKYLLLSFVLLRKAM